jgi:hypothetical protein
MILNPDMKKAIFLARRLTIVVFHPIMKEGRGGDCFIPYEKFSFHSPRNYEKSSTYFTPPSPLLSILLKEEVEDKA